MKTIDFNLLAALDALLSSSSVSVAAHRMHLSTPAMSHTLARIRDALGDPILVRAGRKLVPTARALELREPVRRLVAEARELMQPSGAAELTHLRREFVVRAPDGVAIVYGAAMLAELQRAMPLATLRFVPESDSDALALREGRIDLDIGTVHDRGPEIQTALLSEQRLVGAVRQGHALATGRVTLSRFVAEAHVAIAQRGRSREAVDLALAEAGAARHVMLSVPSAYGALMAAAQSSMLACAPEPLARGVAPGLGLVLVKLPVLVPVEQVVQAWHPRMHADAAHQWLRRCVLGLSVNAGKPPLPALEKGAVAQAPTRHQALLAMVNKAGKRR
jgi:DNA-binding transcriptional LysR family regulator